MNNRLTVSGRIRKYIIDRQKAGKLNGGDKLPSYDKLCKRFNVSYASVQYAFKEFENEGLVERIQGVGTFLKGAEPLEIEMFLDTSAFPPEKLEPLLNSEIEKRGLHLQIKIHNLLEAHNIGKPGKNRRAVIVQDTSEPHFNLGSLLDLSTFNDYRFVIGQLKTFNNGGCNVALPFLSFTYQIAFNPKLLKETGFSGAIRGDNLDWWNSYVECCHKNKIIPASKSWQRHSLNSFASIYYLIFPLIIRERGTSSNLVSLPLFDTTAGCELLKVMRDQTTYSADKKDAPGFCNGNVGVNLGMGSWLAVHYKEKFNLPGDEFRIVPHRFGQRKICPMTVQYLKPFVCADIKPDEKERIWNLLKIFISQDFQIELCKMSGMVSVRKDMTREDHPWNTRDDFSAFFPVDDDIIIYNDIFNERVKTALSVLYEQYELYGADKSQILTSMDKKVESMIVPT